MNWLGATASPSAIRPPPALDHHAHRMRAGDGAEDHGLERIAPLGTKPRTLGGAIRIVNTPGHAGQDWAQLVLNEAFVRTIGYAVDEALLSGLADFGRRVALQKGSSAHFLLVQAVVAQLAGWPVNGAPRRAGVSSFGIGGTNAHVIVQEAPLRQPSGASRKQQLIVQSAKSIAALDAGSQALAAHFESNPQANLADAAYTLRIGRRAMKQRRVVVAHDAKEAARLLASKDAARVFSDTATEDPRSVAFMFAGGGAQHPTCFSTETGLYCGCFRISTLRLPLSITALVAASISPPNFEKASISR